MEIETEEYMKILKELEKKLGDISNFMRFLPRDVLLKEWPLWKSLGEIDMERGSYLLSADSMIEEMLDKTRVKINEKMNIWTEDTGCCESTG